MSSLCVYLPMAPYLAQWFIHNQGGTEPVQLSRRSVESKMLELFLTRRPEGAPVQTGGEGMVAIAIPTFRSRPAQTYNYLPRRARQALLSVILNRFDVQLYTELHQFGNLGKEQKELVYAWMEKHGIEEDERNWLAITKRYQRLREVYCSRRRAAKAYERLKGEPRNKSD